MSQTNRPAWSLSLLTIGGQWVCGWSKVSTDQKMPGLPVRGDTYGDETSCYNRNLKTCKATTKSKKIEAKTTYVKQLEVCESCEDQN